jgi:TonB family protein
VEVRATRRIPETMRRIGRLARSFKMLLLRIATGSVAVFLFVAFLCSCQRLRPTVKYMADPTYPQRVRFQNVQGDVRVAIQIGADGRVTQARGIGEDKLLVEAAEQCASQMVFESRLPFLKPPAEYVITFRYRLLGKPSFVDYPPMVEKDGLPDLIEIFGKPLVSDYPPLSTYRQLDSARTDPPALAGRP